MNYTTLSSRVPNTQVTSSFGLPADIGLAPAISGQIPDHVSSDGTNDDTSQNPHGRDVSDTDGTRPKLLSSRNHILISTFNSRTLNPTSRLNELVLNAKEQKIDIIAIQEHRFFHPDTDLQYHKIGDYQLITSSCLKNSSNASIGGVGLLLSSKAMDNLSNIERISSRIIIADFVGNPKSTVISCYSPTNSSSDDDINDFYNGLRSVMENVPAHNFLTIPGDFNAKLGPDDAKFTYHTETNCNGELLVDFMEEFNLFPANTKFMKSKNKLWTFEYPNGAKAQLDYVLIRRKWQNSVKECRPYSSFSSIGSDHRIVTADVKLSLRVSKKSPPNPMKSIDWKKVSSDKDLSSQYAVNVFNRFQELSSSPHIGSDNIDSIYNNLIVANEEVALSTLPKNQIAQKSDQCRRGCLIS